MEEVIAKLVVNKLDALYGVKEKYTEEEIYNAFAEASKKPNYADEKVKKIAERMRKKLETDRYKIVKTPLEPTEESTEVDTNE